jgi:hypothetical protein
MKILIAGRDFFPYYGSKSCYQYLILQCHSNIKINFPMKKTIINTCILMATVMPVFGQSVTTGSSFLSLESNTVDNDIRAYRANVGGAPVTNGRVLLSINARGEAGATPNIPNAKIDFVAEENFTATSRATGISFNITKPNTFLPQRAMLLSSKGFLAVGNLTPNARLQLENGYVNRKIVLHEVANNDHEVTGFGVMGGLRYQIPNTTESHIFYTGTSASSSNELMRIQGNGNVGIGTSNATDAKLQIIGGSSRGLQSSSTAEMGVRGLSDSNYGVSGESQSSTGVYGESQTGRGVSGVSNSGVGVSGFSTSNQAFYGNNNSVSNPTARFDNQAAGGNALHVQGGIKVSGSSPAALRLETNTDVFSLPVPTTSANAQTDLLFVTRATGIAGGTSTAYYAKWDGATWEIRREDNGTITAGTNINVLVIKQ